MRSLCPLFRASCHGAGLFPLPAGPLTSYSRPIAFHPASVIFETPNHAALIEKVGVRQLVSGVIDELMALAELQGCKFPPDFKDRTIMEMAKPLQSESLMWQDYAARRPMEVDTFLGSPLRLSQEAGIAVPRLETLYTIMHNLNTINRTRPKGEYNGPAPSSPTGTVSMAPRTPSQVGGRPMANGGQNGASNGGGGRPRPRTASQMGPPGRRPPVSMNGPPNGYGRPPPSRQQSRRGSIEGTDLEEFSHLVLYNDIPEGGPADSDLALRERELQLRQRELALKEQEMRMRRPGPSARRGPPPGPPARNGIGIYDDDDEDDDYFDPNMGPPTPMIDADNFDMMSVTSRKNRKAPGSANNAQFRKNGDSAPASRNSRFRPNFGRNRSSQIVDQAPPVGSNILDDPLMSFTSNRYGNVDRGMIHAESRANSLTASRMEDLQFPPGSSNGHMGGHPRRVSHSPGNAYSQSMRGGVAGRPSPPNGFGGPANGRPSPPDGVRQPVPRYPPGQGNAVAPHQVEQHAGVSSLQPPIRKNVRSLTGSASASARSSDSAHLDSEPSAHSSQSSLGPRPPIGVR